MFRIHAISFSAKVIDLKTVWDFTDKVLIRRAVRVLHFIAYAKRAVIRIFTPGLSAQPNPTINGLSYFRPKPILKSFHTAGYIMRGAL